MKGMVIMFVVSVKTTKIKFISFLVCLTFVLIAGILFFAPKDTAAETAKNARGIDFSASDDAQRIAFLRQFGVTVKDTPIETREVVIPGEFDNVYAKYNEIQKSQNLDLTKYKNKRVKRYTYEVANYPGRSAGVRANLLVYEDKVIGGDVSTVELDGFMHGFKINQQ